ncbi:acyl carrier protein [Streptomyces sp. NPDC005017]|uniref:acyl carrier protein n=1 Tax=Streptomyces sp. NPDC005017 TaxID=3364706 RepID=UPI0036CBD903
MPDRPFTIDDLAVMLRDSAGDPDEACPGGDILDTTFGALGYDSLVLLETVVRIEDAYGITLDDAAPAKPETPRALIQAVNEILRAER